MQQVKTDLAALMETLQIRSAVDVLRVAATMTADARRRADVRRAVEQAAARAGHKLDAAGYYQMGMLYAAMNEYETAEACLLEAIRADANAGDAYFGLSILYQRRATELLQESNFGLAEDALGKATDYAKQALLENPASVGVQVQLGYVYKDMGQRYLGIGRQGEAEQAFQKARTQFRNAASIDPADADAHNGLGSIAMLQHDFRQAIEESGRAVELNPQYLFARYDLSQAYYFAAMTCRDKKEQLGFLRQGLEQYRAALELDGAAPGQDRLPAHARAHLESLWAPWEARIQAGQP